MSSFDCYLPVTPLYFCLQMISLANVNGFLPNLLCALILWRSDVGLLMGKVLSIFDRSYLPATSLVSFTGNNFSKYHWIFTTLGMCINIVEVFF